MNTLMKVWALTGALFLCAMGAQAQPMTGSYDIGGGGGHFASFGDAVVALHSRGVSGPVTMNVFGSDYNEALVINQINGASSVNRVTFYDSSGTARLYYTGTAPDGVIKLSGADFVTFDGIDLYAGGATVRCVTLTNIAQSNIIRNASLTVSAYAATAYPVYMTGSSNHYNQFSNLTISTGANAFRLASPSTAGQQSMGTVIENCTISNVRLGVYCNYMDNLHVRDCDFQLNNAGTLTEGVYGIYVDVQAAGDTIHFYRNRVHNIVATSSNGSGLARLKATSGTSIVHNNMCYDFQIAGNANVRGLSMESGSCYAYYNSIHVNDVVATGIVYMSYYTSATGFQELKNNIFACEEATRACYGLYGTSESYMPDALDYNLYYFTGSGDTLSRFSTTRYLDLAALQTGTVHEDHGLEANPGFVSPSDLHITTSIGNVNNVGTVISGIGTDIDGDSRSATPDIGADEYDYAAPAADFSVTQLFNIQHHYSEFLTYSIGARVLNRGGALQTNVPVRLFFKGTQQLQQLVTLAPDEADTIYFDWFTPLAPDSGLLKVQSFVPGDADVANDSAVATVLIVGQPMSGPYEIGGGGMDYATISDAARDMVLRTISGPVTFFVYGATYTEAVALDSIIGASSTNTVVFQEFNAHITPAVLTNSVGTGTLKLNGADYVTFEGIDIVATGGNMRAVDITGNADYNIIRNCSITGANISNTGSYGVYINGGGNDGNIVENVTISGGHYAYRASGIASASDLANELRNSSILQGKYCVYLERQNNTKVFGCDIQPGWVGAVTEIIGVNVGTHAAGMTSYFYNNRIHNFRTSLAANGIYTTSGANFRAYNNWIYDFQIIAPATSALYAIRAVGGNVEFYYNSILIGDVLTTGGTTGLNGVYISGTNTVATVKNNIFQLDEPDVACFAVNRTAGTLISDYNAFYSVNGGANFTVGRDSVTSYATLALWQGGTTYDDHSKAGNPGYFASSDLHIQPTFSLLDSAGVAIFGITLDMDGDERTTPPDIGADEYTFAPYEFDFGVNRFIGISNPYIANLPVTIQAVVQDFGSQNAVDVPVVLYYNDNPVDTVLASVTTGHRDTVDFSWTPPDVGMESGTLRAQSYLPDDAFAENDSATVAVDILGGQMMGEYDLGGGNMDFTSFNEALTAMLSRGVVGAVTFNCYAGTYSENLTLPAIAGFGAGNRLTFRATGGTVNLTAAAGSQVLYLNGADYVTFDGINITAQAPVNICVYLDNGSTQNIFRNLSITGRDSADAATRGIRVHFLGNDNNLFEGLHISGVAYGFRNETGSASDESTGLEIRNCMITGGTHGIYLDNIHNARVWGNDIQPFGNSTISAYGVYISSLTTGDTVYVYDNRIHNIRQTYNTSFPQAAAILSGPSTGTGTIVYVYNNEICDFIVSKSKVAGLIVGAGSTHAYHNSIHINDVASDTVIAGVTLTSTLSQATLYNNVIVISEPTATCWAVRREVGTLNASDYNLLYGSGSGFHTGRASLADFVTLANWQGLGYDLHSVQADPGFVGPADLHLANAVSPACNVGTPIALVSIDMDGQSRDNPPDMGADEYSAGLPPEAVTDLTILPDADAGTIILDWSPAANATGYRIYAGATVDFVPSAETLLGTTTSTNYTHANAFVTGTLLFYQVVATSGE